MRKILSLSAALALALVVAACGGSSRNDGSQGAASAKPIPELRWSFPPVRRADVQTSFDFPTMWLEAPVSPGLVKLDASGKVEMALAASVEQPDDRTYVYALRRGVKFSDGSPLTAEDVAWSMNRNMEKSANTNAMYANVRSIAAQGEDAVVVKLKTPDVTWQYTPSYAGQVIKKDAAIAGGLKKLGTSANLPVGTGPYKLTSFNPDVGATLEPNPHWTGEKPRVQKLTIKFLKDDAAVGLALRSGDIDGTFVGTRKTLASPGITVKEMPGTTQIALSMNTQAEPYNDVHVRRAIAYATDREGLVQAIYSGAAKIDEGITPQTLYAAVGSKDEVAKMFDSLPKYDFDIEAAKAEMAKSKYPNGFTMKFPAPPLGQAAKVAQAMKPDLAKLGIKVQIDEMTDSEYLELFYGPREKIGFLLDFYGSTYPDPNLLLTWWLAPEQAKANGLNSANYKNPRVGKLLVQQRQESDPARRLELIRELLTIVKRDVPYVPLYSPTSFMAISDKYTVGEVSWWTQLSPWPLRVSQAS